MTVVLPYKTPPRNTVTWGAWSIATEPDGPLNVEGARWTLGTDLLLSTSFTILKTPLLRNCGLETTAPIELVLAVASSGPGATRIKKALGAWPIRRGGSLPVENRLIPGMLVGGKIHLTATVRLAAPVGSVAPTPSRRGSILWQETRTHELQEDLNVLRVVPVEEANRSSSLWSVQADLSDLDRPFVDAIRIAVNVKSPLARQLIDAENSPQGGPRAQFLKTLQQLMIVDVRRQLVELALLSDDLAEHSVDDDDESSVAAVLLAQLRVIFTGEDLAALRARFLRDPVDITQRVQHAVMKRFGL